MASRIEDYALIGNTRTGALLGRDGSIDWLCLPRFDSPACFAALLGRAEHGRWLLAPHNDNVQVSRRYLPGTLVLETHYRTHEGAVRIVDCMSHWEKRSDVVRIVHGVEGRVAMHTELIMRFDYGSIVPWVRKLHSGVLTATAGPDSVEVRTPVELHGEDYKTVARFSVSEGQTIPFVMSHFASHAPPPLPIDPYASVEAAMSWWGKWSASCAYDGEWRDTVLRSLITLKALTYAPTGGIIAAPTASLPEQLRGVRNWDYRYCWLRDATFVLYSLLIAGYREEASAWREWLLRAVAGRPEDLHILYGLAGERRLSEKELPWLPGYEGAAPVRIGNAACEQFQLDVYGEVMDALHLTRAARIEPEAHAWQIQRALLDFLESRWEHPDHGIWEVRGPRRHFTHSKVMAWVAMDRAVKAVERFGLEGPVDHWKDLRTRIHEQVCREGFNPDMGAFVQSYGSENLDASLLMIPLVGFLPAKDPRVQGTVEAIRRKLAVDGLIMRYSSAETVDGLPPGEGAFLPCSFWLVDNLALLGRQEEARRLFERLLSLCNEVGLISEGYDPVVGRLVGNFPQAISHVALINSARNLSHSGGPSEHRGSSGEKSGLSL